MKDISVAYHLDRIAVVVVRFCRSGCRWDQEKRLKIRNSDCGLWESETLKILAPALLEYKSRGSSCLRCLLSQIGFILMMAISTPPKHLEVYISSADSLPRWRLLYVPFARLRGL